MCIYISALLTMSIDGGQTYNADRAVSHGHKEMNVAYMLSLSGLITSFILLIVGKIIDVFQERIFSITIFFMVAYVLLFSTSDYFPNLLRQALWFTLFDVAYGTYYTTTTIIFRFPIFS